MSTLKEQIHSLREQGLSYSEIQNKLGCSKSTISYYLGQGQSEKTMERTRKLRKEKPLIQKIDKFKQMSGKLRKSFNERMKAFHCIDNRTKLSEKIEPLSFTHDDLLSKFNGKCYLTGREINLTDTKSYNLDHVIPRSKGGPNTLENCNFACSEANFAKGNLSLEEFQQLCLEVVNHFKLK